MTPSADNPQAPRGLAGVPGLCKGRTTRHGARGTGRAAIGLPPGGGPDGAAYDRDETQEMGVKKLIAGNWKMHGLMASLGELDSLSARLTEADHARNEVWVFPPATLLAPLQARQLPGIAYGGQDCHAEAFGAMTGEISAEMIADLGGQAVIVGHSERRNLCGETDAMVRKKATAAHRAGLVPIVCVGEPLAERDAGRAADYVSRQVDGSWPGDGPAVLAYEPLWAIGTGRVPTPDDMAEMHDLLKSCVGRDRRILYGGSVKGSNAATILGTEGVDGVLVGGASLSADDFYAIISV